MAKKSRVGSFKGKVGANANKRKQGSGFSYLSLPKGVEIFTPEADNQYVVDFMVYEVTTKNHPDRDDRLGIATKGDYWYKLPFRTHKSVGVKNEKVVCPQSIGKPCPICDYKAGLKKNDGDEDEIKSLNTSERNLYALRLPLDKKNREKMFVYDASDYLFQEEFESQLKRDERWESFIHPSEGCSVKLTYDEDSFAGNKYAKVTRFDFETRKVQYEDDVLDEVPNLDECLIILSYDQLKAKFFEADIEEDEENEKPAKKGVKKEEPKKPSKKVVEEEEDEDEDEPEEETDLAEEINAAKKVDQLLEIATDNPDMFKKHMKTLKTITKLSLLKTEMLAIVEPEEEEEEDEPEEIDTNDLINEAEDIPALLAIVKEYPTTFKAYVKELRQFTKVRLMKKRMLEIAAESADEDDDLPFEKEETKTPPKKQTEKTVTDQCPSGHVFGKDNDDFEDCEDCPLWNPCYKKSKEK